MTAYEVQLVFNPIGEATENRLVDELSVSVEVQAGLWTVVGYVEAVNGAVAILNLTRQLHQLGVNVERANPELVNAATIAERAGVSRQAVTNWTHNTSNDCFPRPWCVVAGRPVWEWHAVNEWLRARGHNHDDCAYPTLFEVGQANAEIAYTHGNATPDLRQEGQTLTSASGVTP